MLHLKTMRALKMSPRKTTVILTEKARHMGHCFGTASCKQVQWNTHVNMYQTDTNSGFGN